MNKTFMMSVLFLIFSCTGGGGGGSSSGGSSGSESNKLTPISSLSSLNGKYNPNQVDNLCTNLNSEYSQLTYFEFSNNTFKAFYFGFHEQDCYGIPAYKIIDTGSIVLNGDNEITISESSSEGKLLTNTAVTDANTDSFCGLTGWTKDVAKDVSANSDCSLWGDLDYVDWWDISISDNVISYTNKNGSYKLYPIKTKSTFSLWANISDSTYSVDASGQSDNVSFTTTIKTQISQTWINALNTAGRDTSGLVAGQEYSCSNATINIDSAGSTHESIDDIGYVSINMPDTDNPTNNACLEQDNNCDIGVCNYDDLHIYYRFADKLFVNYFAESNSDGGVYVSDKYK